MGSGTPSDGKEIGNPSGLTETMTLNGLIEAATQGHETKSGDDSSSVAS
jgi:hypothetical protein